MENTFKQKEIRQVLKDKGLKITQARLALLDTFQHAKKPLSIKDIAKHLVDFDQATLYRNVEALQESGMIKQIRFENRQMYYELASGKHHHHMVCENCGKVADIENCGFIELPQAALKNSDFSKINRHSLEFFGVCKNCNK